MLRKSSDVAVELCDDSDLLEQESKLDDGKGNGMWPRLDRAGNQIRTWDRYRQNSVNEIGRRLRSSKSTAEPAEMGRLDLRSRGNLRECAACFALHFLFVDADNSGDAAGFFARKAAHYWERGGALFEAELPQLDYDIDNSGTIEEIEKNEPFIARFIRG